VKPYAEIAVAFAEALVDGRFDDAPQLLAPQLRTAMTPDRLRENLYAMFRGYSEWEPTSVDFDEEEALDPVHDDWPAKQPGDVGWSCIGIDGEDFMEAVTVTVADFDGELLIRAIEWGRP
jgi:hypothetical protein